MKREFSTRAPSRGALSTAEAEALALAVLNRLIEDWQRAMTGAG